MALLVVVLALVGCSADPVSPVNDESECLRALSLAGTAADTSRVLGSTRGARSCADVLSIGVTSAPKVPGRPKIPR